MARSVFFSFNYQRDIMRVHQIKQHYFTKETHTETGFFVGSLEEKAQKEGDLVVKNMINKGLVGSSVLCVLIGKETYTRRWVDYEILKAVENGMGVFGIRIHQLKDPKAGADTIGSSPFIYLGYGTKNGEMRPMIQYKTGWQDAPYLSTVSESAAPYLKMADRPVLSSLFKTTMQTGPMVTSGCNSSASCRTPVKYGFRSQKRKPPSGSTTSGSSTGPIAALLQGRRRRHHLPTMAIILSVLS